MKKTLVLFFSAIIFLTLSFLTYLTIFGFETDKFNPILEKKISESQSDLKINLEKIKVKIDIKKLSFYVTAPKPKVKYKNTKFNLKKIDAYIDLSSFVFNQPEIYKANIVSEEIQIKELKKIAVYLKPSTFKKFLMNDVNNGKVNFNLEIDLQENKIKNYEINGFVKNLSLEIQKKQLKNLSFIYLIRKNFGELNNIRGNIEGFQINAGDISFKQDDNLEIIGNLKSDFELDKTNFDVFVDEVYLKTLTNIEAYGNLTNKFVITFDDTLKVSKYDFSATGNLKKSKINFDKFQKYIFVKNEIQSVDLEKVDFKIDLNNLNKKKFDISGLYKINKKAFNKFNFSNLINNGRQNINLTADYDNGFNIPLLNYSSKNKIVNLETKLQLTEKTLNLNLLSLKEGKTKILVNNLFLKDKKLIKFNKISVQTFNKNMKNNDFNINYKKKIEIKGLKYDASNLIKILSEENNSNFLKNISKEISVNFDEVNTSESDTLLDFNLIGYIDNGKFNKIVSKGEFQDNKYLEISLIKDKSSKNKILEIYSDIPKTLLSSYSFFKGLSGGQLLLNSTYNPEKSNTKLTIENFKVSNAPGLVKLLSLADFGGMVDAMSGEGLSFERLEIIMEKDSQILSLKELYAIGPSISILMEGYVDSKTGLISLRGTMVPAKTLNRFLSKLPIVGDIIIPKEIGEGLFGISFKMKGLPGNVKTTVNPIKTLTPRFIQKAIKKTK